jgi:hypothetical protein
MKWFKLHTEARNDAKLRSLSDSQHRVWFNLLCFAAEQERRGTINDWQDSLLAVEVANGNVEILKETLQVLVRLRIITYSEKAIIFTNFDKRQYSKPSDNGEQMRLRTLGNLPAQKVDRQKVKDLLVDTLAIRSAKSVELTHAVISGIFAEAIDNKMVMENPAQGLRKEALTEGKDVTYLYPGITQRLVQKGLERACRTAKVRLRHPHDLRHYAAILLMDHYSPAYVQKQLGHSSITMTVETYGHWIPGEGKKDLRRTLGDKIDEQVGRARRAD